MSDLQENAQEGSLPTSEVGYGAQERSGCGIISERNVNNPDRAAGVASAGHSVGSSEAATLLQLLRGLADGVAGSFSAPAPVVLIKFDPDDPDADIEGWCSITEIIIKQKDIKGTDLLLPLMQALRGRAATCLTKIHPDSLTWENVKTTLIPKFAKPMLIQNYFERVIKFKVQDKETAADAGMRLWHMIESIPKVEFCEEVITGFAVSILSNTEQSLRRELNAHTITSKTQLCRILRGVTLKRQNDDTTAYIENKRPRFSNQCSVTSIFSGTCHCCGEIGHKIMNCPEKPDASFQVNKHKPVTSTAAPSRYEERRPVACYACGKQGHVASAYVATAPLRGTNQVATKEVKHGSKRVVTGELHVADE